MRYQSVLGKKKIEYGYSQAARPIFSIAEGSQQLKRGRGVGKEMNDFPKMGLKSETDAEARAKAEAE